MIIRYQYEDAALAVALEPLGEGRYQATIGERSYTVEARRLPDGGWLLSLDGQRVLAFTAAQGSDRYLWVDGQTYTLAVAGRQSRNRARAASSDELTAQMPGQILQVLVKPDDYVERGQLLVVMEAMKMEMRVSAPANGRVTRVLVAPGDVVERGQRLVQIE